MVSLSLRYDSHSETLAHPFWGETFAGLSSYPSMIPHSLFQRVWPLETSFRRRQTLFPSDFYRAASLLKTVIRLKSCWNSEAISTTPSILILLQQRNRPSLIPLRRCRRSCFGIVCVEALVDNWSQGDTLNH
jgi:hypothetical protein